MKRPFLAFGFVLIAGLSVALLGQAAFNRKHSVNGAAVRLLPFGLAHQSQIQSFTYSNAVTGEEINAGHPDVITIAGNAVADETATGLPGHVVITIRFNRTTNAVIGGEWFFTAIQPGNSDEAGGTLHGTIARGNVSLSEAGKVTTIEAVELNVAGGNGQYRNITTGSGSFAGTLKEAAIEPAGAAPQESITSASSSSPSIRPAPPSLDPSAEHRTSPFSGTLKRTF